MDRGAWEAVYICLVFWSLTLYAPEDPIKLPVKRREQCREHQLLHLVTAGRGGAGQGRGRDGGEGRGGKYDVEDGMTEAERWCVVWMGQGQDAALPAICSLSRRVDQQREEKK